MGGTLRRVLGQIPRLSLRNRTVLVLVPVHVAAFVALYLGMVGIVRNEILRTHSRDARLLLSEAVRDLHPYMCNRDRKLIPVEVGQFARRHSLLDLRVFRSDGSPMSSAGQPDSDVAAFLDGAESDRFDYASRDGMVSLRGIARIRSQGSCVQCHQEGEQLGAATMMLDLTAEVGAAEDRLKFNLALLIAGWTLAVGVFNIGLVSWTRRSLARIQTDLNSASAANGAARPGIAAALLDPVSAEIYASVSRLLRERDRRQETVDHRLRHTDRLASLGQLAAGLAHEIKNPLAGIRGVMELMRDEAETAERRDLYEQIVGELDRVNGTIHSLLHFARPTLPKRELVDVKELIESSVKLLRPPLAKRAIELTVDVAADVGAFALDSSQMRQVVTNLVSNAADAIDHDGVIAVKVSLVPAGSGLIIAVRDDGPGITEDVKKRLFEPFFTTKFSGTGLGLAVVESLVRQHGGRIEIESTIGRGSTFFVLLPGENSWSELEAGDAGPRVGG